MGRKLMWCESCEERTLHEVTYGEPNVCCECGLPTEDDDNEWGDQ